MTKKSSANAVWCNRGWLPIYFSFCPSEEAWKKEMRRLKTVGTPYPVSDARMSSFEKDGTDLACIVTVRDGSEKDHDTIEVMALIAHEAAHVWQAACRSMGEDDPSSEFEAYSIQHITQQLVRAFHETRGLPRLKAA